MKTEMMNIDDLVPYDKNPRQNESGIDAVKKSIKKHGFNVPIVINQKNVICTGHTRYYAALDMGMKKVPVYKKKMTQKIFTSFNVADNKTSEKTTWDNQLLRENMQLLYDLEDDDMEATGFDEKEIEMLLDVEDLDNLVDVEGHTREIGGEKKHIKLVQIFLDDITFPKFIEMCETIQAYMTTNDISDTVYNAVEKVYDEVREL